MRVVNIQIGWLLHSVLIEGDQVFHVTKFYTLGPTYKKKSVIKSICLQRAVYFAVLTRCKRDPEHKRDPVYVDDLPASVPIL